MDETFTEHQVRTGLAAAGLDEQAVETALRAIREAPRNAGALGYTDDELKGTAR